MKKKVLSLLLALAMVLPLCPVFELPLLSTPVFAATSGTTGDCTWTLDGTVLTISGNGKMGNYSSSSPAPWGKTITEVVIENGVTSIGNYAFRGCSSLTSITIPDSVTSIGYGAFSGCSSLTSVTIPDSVTSIGDYAFSGCSSLTSITIPDSVTSIGAHAFNGCSSLASITIPDSVTSIGVSAFYRTKWLGDQPEGVVYAGKVAYDVKGTCPATVTLKEGTLGIANYAFSGCNSLTSITIPDSVTSIGGSAFSGCSSLTSVTIPDSVTSIGNGAFSDCSSLATLSVASGNPVYHSNGNCIIKTASKTLDFGCKNSVIPADGSVTTIGSAAFYGCTFLTSITIPDSVTTIGQKAFYNCDSLTTITIPDSVTSIGNGAFSGTKWLEDQPEGVVYAGKVAYDVKGTCPATVTLKEGTLGIANYAFYYCSSLTSVTIPDGVTSIGSYAFSWCDSLTSTTIPDSVTSIGNYAFYYCDRLASVIIPDSVTSIGAYAFYDCSSLASITIPDGVTSIGGSAFSSCSSLASVTIPDSVTTIGNCAFEDCSSLTSVTIPDSVTTIGSDAFSGCSSLTSIIIPDSVTTIGSDAFSGCSSLTSIIIPDSVTTIGNEVFRGCSKLTSITIPDSVTSIGAYAFYGCRSLTDVWYEGSAADRAKISIGVENGDLTSATWHYNFCIKNPASEKVHVYDNACDTDCNVCGAVRTITHNYSAQDKDETNHWLKCSVCGTIDVTSVVAHVYNNACDTDCNICGEDRTPPHDYTARDKDETNHWLKCSLCGTVDESSRASHVYDDFCFDTDCNFCGATRIPPHVFDSATDSECNLCQIYRPVPPVAEAVVGTTVTLLATEGFEYSLDGNNWQASPVFENLDPVTTYTFYQRQAEDAFHFASLSSLGTSITTKKATPAAPSAPTAEEIKKDSVTLVSVPGIQYSLDGITWNSNPVFTGLRRNTTYTFYARLAETSTHYASPASVALVVKTLKDVQSALKAPSLEAVTGISVTLVSAPGIEFSMDGETWQSEAVFRGLSPDTEYTFYQRQAEKEDYYASPASAPLVVKTLPVIPGDTDGDDVITMDDAIYVLFHTSFPTEYPANQDLDFNGDGKVDMDDAAYLMFYVFFPDRFPLH